jgi:pimeloyl-ACP methyl ester carboxylesterase
LRKWERAEIVGEYVASNSEGDIGGVGYSESARPNPVINASDRNGLIVALHCSGADASQWRPLGDALGTDYELATPEHYGSDAVGPWDGSRVFTLADEAERTIALIDGADREVHLVGHSYGGGVALHVALARPHRITSIALYEPAAFHLLRQMDGPGADAFAEIAAITRQTGRDIVVGNYRGAAARFVDYWGGEGAWDALSPKRQLALTRWAPKAPLDFAALIAEPATPNAYAALRFPILLMRGERAPAPTRLIAEKLAVILPDARLRIVSGASHMGPFTHRMEVNALIAAHAAGAGLR